MYCSHRSRGVSKAKEPYGTQPSSSFPSPRLVIHWEYIVLRFYFYDEVDTFLPTLTKYQATAVWSIYKGGQFAYMYECNRFGNTWTFDKKNKKKQQCIQAYIYPKYVFSAEQDLFQFSFENVRICSHEVLPAIIL